MRKTHQELSMDPIVQISCLRLERPPLVSSEINQEIGKVFDFSRVDTALVPVTAASSSDAFRRRPERVEDGEVRREMVTESTRRLNENNGDDKRLFDNEHYKLSRQRGDDGYSSDREDGVKLGTEDNGEFVMGDGDLNGTERSSHSKNSHSSRSSWVRRNQSKAEAL